MTIFSISPKEFRAFEVFVCEFIGSAVMLCFGCMSLFASPEGFTNLPPLQGGVAWGLIVCTISLATGYISGAQCNPCITLCFLILERISFFIAFVYMMAQLLGSLVGMGLAVVLVPEGLFYEYKIHERCGFCTTHPSEHLTEIQVFILEYWSTFLLVLCVCGAQDPRMTDGRTMNPLRFAFLISMLVFVVGPFTGTSLNPFRSLAPAIFSNCWRAHYMYWLGPIGGSASATLLYKHVIKR